MTSFRDWQPGHLRLSAPALQLLLKGPDHNPSDILGLAVRELVGRGILTPMTLQSGEGMQTVHTAAFGTGRPAPNDLEGSLRSVVAAHAKATTHEGMVTIQELARALRDAHDGTLAQWVEDDVLAVLLDRKLYETEEGKRLGIIPTTSTELTAEGRASQAQLKESLAYVEDNWDGWASKDQQRAQTLLDLAGSGILLVPDIHESIAHFRALQTNDAGYPAATISSSTDAPRFEFDRLVLYARDLRVMDDVFAYTHLDEDRDNDPSTRR